MNSLREIDPARFQQLIPGPEAHLHLHLCLKAPSVGGGLSLQEKIRAEMEKFYLPTFSKQRVIKMTQEENLKSY